MDGEGYLFSLKRKRLPEFGTERAKKITVALNPFNLTGTGGCKGEIPDFTFHNLILSYLLCACSLIWMIIAQKVGNLGIF